MLFIIPNQYHPSCCFQVLACGQRAIYWDNPESLLLYENCFTIYEPWCLLSNTWNACRTGLCFVFLLYLTAVLSWRKGERGQAAPFTFTGYKHSASSSCLHFRIANHLKKITAISLQTDHYLKQTCVASKQHWAVEMRHYIGWISCSLSFLSSIWKRGEKTSKRNIFYASHFIQKVSALNNYQ